MVAMCIFNRLASLRSAKFGLYLINVTMPVKALTASLSASVALRVAANAAFSSKLVAAA